MSMLAHGPCVPSAKASRPDAIDRLLPVAAYTLPPMGNTESARDQTMFAIERAARETSEARNALENYVYSMKATLSDGEKGVADKIGDDDKETIEKALEEANEWLDDNQEAEKEDFDEKLKEVQDACSPIISKVYQESGGAPGGGGCGGDDDLDGHDEL